MKKIWEGIYPEFPKQEGVATFSATRWINRQIEEAKSLMALRGTLAKTQSILGDVLIGYGAQTENPIRVLDFGGGLALEYLKLQVRNLPMDRLDYYVIENKDVCQVGESFYTENNIHFFADLSHPHHPYDIFYAESSFQYLENWKKALLQIFDHQPKLLLLCGMLVGNIPTFSTLQTYYEHQLPVWFLNQEELRAFLELHHYKLVSQQVANARYFGKQCNLPMQNFPKPYRLRRKCNLIFQQCSESNA